MFRGAPLGLKLSATCLVLLGCFGVFNFLLSGLPIMMSECQGACVQGIAIFIVLLVMLFHMLKAVVRGSIPSVCIMALGVLGWWVADSFSEFLVVLVSLEIFLFSFLTPAARRWGRKIREEDLACWIAARSGAFPFWRMVAKFVLKKMVIGVLLVVCLGTCAYTHESIEIMCDWLKRRSEDVVSCLFSGGLPSR